MSNTGTVQVSDCRKDLLDNIDSVLLRIVTTIHNSVKQFAARDPVADEPLIQSARFNKQTSRKYVQLHDNIDLIFIFVNLVELEDRRVRDFLHDFDFATKEFNIVLNQTLFNNFDCIFLAVFL